MSKIVFFVLSSYNFDVIKKHLFVGCKIFNYFNIKKKITSLREQKKKKTQHKQNIYY